jgi:hypothetical protein
MIQAKPRPKPVKHCFSVEQANKMLPLVGAVVKDIVPLAGSLLERQDRLTLIKPTGKERMSPAHEEEFEIMRSEFERDASRLEEYLDELRQLGVELKGWDGIVDFPGEVDGKAVSLCWKLGEPEVAHWHPVDSGFAGRKKLVAATITND